MLRAMNSSEIRYTLIEFCASYTAEQSDHKKCVGTNGLYEAIYHGVPMLGLPLLVDQFDNMLRVSERGAGLTMDITKLTENDLFNHVNE